MNCKIKFNNKQYEEKEFSEGIRPTIVEIRNKAIKAGLETKDDTLIINTKKAQSDVVKSFNSVVKINSEYKEKFGISENVLQRIHKNDHIYKVNINELDDILIKIYEAKEAAKRAKTIYGDNPELFDEEGNIVYQVVEDHKKSKQPDAKLEKVLENFLKNNNINVKVLATLKERLGVDAFGAYDITNKLVLLAQDRLDSTLPEEVGHVIVETLGKDHPLIKLLKTKLKKEGYKNYLSDEYFELYKGNEDMLIREAAGKLIGQSLSKKFEAPSALKEIVDKIIRAFKRIFNLSTSNLEKEFSSIKDITEEIASQVLNNEFEVIASDTKPDHAIFYQVKEKTEKVVDPDKLKDNEVLTLLRKRIKTLKAKLKKETNEGIKALISKRITDYENKLIDYKKSSKRSDLIAAARYTLDNIESMIAAFEKGDITAESLTSNDLTFVLDSLSLFRKHPALIDQAYPLVQRFKPIQEAFLTKWINENRTDRQDRTWQELMFEETDINSYQKNIGALADVGSVLGSAAASMIKEVQNRVSRFDKKLAEEIKTEIELLEEAQSGRGVSKDSMYDIFISEGKKTTHFVSAVNPKYWEDYFKAKAEIASGEQSKMEAGKAWMDKYGVKDIRKAKREEVDSKYRNENFFIIQSNPGLKRFYDFFDSKMEEAFDKLPIDRKLSLLPNITEKSLKEIYKSKGLKEAFKDGMVDFLKLQTIEESEDDRIPDLSQNYIPLMFMKDIEPSRKTRDLGNALNVFSRFANNYSEMTELLPKLRLVQDVIKSKTFKSSTTGRIISGENSNLNDLLESYIEMQVKGNMKKDSGKIDLTNVPGFKELDSEGNPIKKVIFASTIGDRLLGYNSLLRIGANPVNAISNVIIGDTSNILESVGGQFFDTKHLHKATSIFFSQFRDEDSKLAKIVEILNPLMELEDYEALTSTAKKMSKEKLKEYMYSLQKAGEYYLQVRPMIASLLSDQIEDKDGNKHSLWEAFDEKGNWKSDLFGELTDNKINKMSNRIQRINQIIHGRYSSRDAGAVTQHVLGRAILQFRKWIPSALEARLMNYHFDNRLGEYVEGRWKTLSRLTLEGMSPGKRSYMQMIQSVFKAKESLEKGDLTPMERANIRKDMMEIVMIIGSVVLVKLLLGGDDDKDKITNPAAKLMAEQLNRISGDLMYFMNPREYISLGRNAIPVAKTLGDLHTTLMNVGTIFGGEDSEYRSGPRKGENKFWSRAGSSIIGVKPITDVIRLFNDQPYIEAKKQ